MIDALETYETPIAIIGMSCRFPGADDPDEFWANLIGGVESIVRGPADGTCVRAVGKVSGTELFDAEFFRIPPAEAAAMDPQNRVLLELSAAALEDAGYLGRHDYVVGVFAGSGENFYYREHVAPNTAFCDNLGELRLALANEKDFLAPRVAFKLGLRGPSLTVQASCSTGLTAVALACQAIAAGDCDLAVAGGASLLPSDVDGYEYVAGGINSADGCCRTFDKLASGTVPSSGAGVVVLKRDDLARSDRDNRYAVIRGWATNNDGGSRAGFTVPNVEGQEAVIRKAMRRAGVRPGDVSYVEAHGTATSLGDQIEFEALRRVFAADDRAAGSCAVGSVKTNIGHTDAAAGMAGLIKAVLAVLRGTIPASLHYTGSSPANDFAATTLFVNAATRPWPPGDVERIAGVSSFGLGGTNAHVIVANAATIEAAEVHRPQHIMVLSARNDEDLARTKARLADRLEAMEPLSTQVLADVAYTLAVARPRYPARWAGVFDTTAELISALREPHVPAMRSNRVALLVDGRHSDLVAVARRHLGVEPLARAALAEYANVLGSNDVDAVFGQLAEHAAGALGVLVCVRAVELAGVRVARVDGPGWAAPILGWLRGGRPMDALVGVLNTRTGGPAESKKEVGPDHVVVGPGLRVADALALAWARGADIDWERYFGTEGRRKVSLPTYPFERRRHWLDKVVPPERPAATDVSAGAWSENVGAVIESAWAVVFGLEAVDPDADFFELGGDSITAIDIGARVNEELGVELPLDLAFQTPTIAAMTTFIENNGRTGADT